ncbi:MAG: hypothetical protein ACR2OJ_10020 [Hyphomicrobiales bacterium]
MNIMFNKWKTLLALALIYIAVLFEWNWVWGALFIFWTIPALYSGRTHLVEEVERKSNPVLFSLIIGTWLILSLYLILADIFSL